MYEVWEITEGPGEGELLVVTPEEYGEIPAKVRNRLRIVINRAFETLDEANQFRRDWESQPAQEATVA